MIDEAFMPFHQIIERMLAFGGEFIDEEQGVRSYIYEYEIESPIELDVVIDEKGLPQLGSTPPLYHVDTSIQPSFHRLRFIAQLSEEFPEDKNLDGIF
jgi:hypothetical protein